MAICVRIDTNTSMPKRSSTPPSRPDANVSGTRRMPRSNTPLKPTMAVSAATSTNAPMASDSGTSALLAISIAAPGVDHAVTTGIRQRSERPMQVTPMPMPSAHNQDAVSASDAPSACAA